MQLFCTTLRALPPNVTVHYLKYRKSTNLALKIAFERRIEKNIQSVGLIGIKLLIVATLQLIFETTWFFKNHNLKCHG